MRGQSPKWTEGFATPSGPGSPLAGQGIVPEAVPRGSTDGGGGVERYSHSDMMVHCAMCAPYDNRLRRSSASHGQSLRFVPELRSGAGRLR